MNTHGNRESHCGLNETRLHVCIHLLHLNRMHFPRADAQLPLHLTVALVHRQPAFTVKQPWALRRWPSIHLVYKQLNSSADRLGRQADIKPLTSTSDTTTCLRYQSGESPELSCQTWTPHTGPRLSATLWRPEAKRSFSAVLLKH